MLWWEDAVLRHGQDGAGVGEAETVEVRGWEGGVGCDADVGLGS